MNYKKILASAMCLCLAMPMTTVIPQAFSNAATVVKPTPLVYDIYQYKKYDDHVEILATSTMVEGIVKVPDIIDGLPVTAAGDHAFAGLSRVTEIGLPNTITTMGKQVFYGDTKLETVVLPNITEIPDETFLNCISLQNIAIPSTVESIGVRAFYGCRSITEINLNNVSSIGEAAFDGTAIHKITLPKNIDTLKEGALWGCSSVQELTIPENVRLIEKRALPSSLRKLTVLSSACAFDADMYKYLPKTCKIVAPKDSLAIQFAEKNGYQYEIYGEVFTASGDANGDNEFNIADLVALKKYMLNGNGLDNWQAADMNGDNKVDVFDYIAMLKKFRENNPMYNPPTEPSVSTAAINLTADMLSNKVQGAEYDSDFILSQTDFALSLFKHELKEENTLVSPYSVMQALAMTANGADGTTKTEMENVLGMPMDKLNKYLYTQRTSQSNNENSKLSTANSIWARNDVSVNKDFLQTNVDYYNADFYVAPFNESTKDDINNWVNEKTDEMIPEVIDQILGDALMYLVNAVAFDAKWETEFDKYATREATFTSYNDEKQKADFMNSTERLYISDEQAKGFCKYYKGQKYAFVALMPNDDISLNDYINGLTAEKLNSLLKNHQSKNFSLSMPKFSYDFNTLLNNSLIDMGMPTAFDGADFSNMIENDDASISRVIHKTHIDVDEAGTKAAAATVVEVCEDCIELPDERLVFDKPFVYFIVDAETDIPVFMGTLSSIEQ